MRNFFALTLFFSFSCLGCRSAQILPGTQTSPEAALDLEQSSHQEGVVHLSDSDSESQFEDHDELVTSEKPRLRDIFRDDAASFLPEVWEDAKGVANWNNSAILGLSLAGAIGIRQGLDEDVRKNTARHPKRWGEFSQGIRNLGEAQFQIAGLLLYRGIALYNEDEFDRNLSQSLLSAFTITGLSTLAIKAIANTDRPTDSFSNGEYGFPSYHTASSFAIASVLDEYYGTKVGLPSYILAGLVGWSRIDEREHDLSDVVFGAALGYVIGKSVASSHLTGDSRVRLVPLIHSAQPATGLAFEVSY